MEIAFRPVNLPIEGLLHYVQICTHAITPNVSDTTVA